MRAETYLLGALLAIPICLGACKAEAVSHDYEVGRSRSGALVYDGRLSDAGAVDLEENLRGGERVAIHSFGGDLEAGVRIAHAINGKGGYGSASGACYSECASSMAFTLDKFIVPDGATILFTKASLRELENDLADSLVACVPAIVPESRYIWASPDVLDGLGIKNVQFDWVLSAAARESYEQAEVGEKVYWLDECARV